jgi:hypothetical protein
VAEEDFWEVSYGFREGLSGHDALKAWQLTIMKNGVNYLIDADASPSLIGLSLDLPILGLGLGIRLLLVF